MGTNIDGNRKVMFAMTAIKGVGRRYANIVLKKADIDLNKRAGECSEEEVEKIVTIMANPRQYKIPDWFLNRQKDIVDGKYSQVIIADFLLVKKKKKTHEYTTGCLRTMLLLVGNSCNINRSSLLSVIVQRSSKASAYRQIATVSLLRKFL